MSTFKEISANDVKTQRSSLTQLVDIVQEDVSGSSTRRKYQVFVTGGLGPGVTSSLFQTVYDQDFTLQTANPIFDFTIGLHDTGSMVQASTLGQDSAGKRLFPSSSLMMREKVDIYRQFAQTLLGDADSAFKAPLNSLNDGDNIEAGMFVAFKRLFARDQIKRETFAMRFYTTASRATETNPILNSDGTNLNKTTETGSLIFTDIGASTNKLMVHGGQVSEIVDSSNTDNKVGLMFNDHGIAVFDLEKITLGTQKVSGTINAVVAASAGTTAGLHIIGGMNCENPAAKFIPDFVVSASIDNILDHLGSCRFSSGTLTAMTFQNVTNINSTLVFCRASADEANYSSNPTFVNSSNRIVVIDEGQEDTQRTFTFITSVGLYDGNDNLLAVGKLSRPVEKNDEKDFSVRVRLDF